MNKKTRTKLILSAIIIVLVIVIYFLPEQSLSVSTNSISDNDFGFNIIGEEQSKESFGTIDIDEEEKHGYGYIKNRKEKQQKFGLIEFDNKLNDSTFIKRTKSVFLTNDIKFYKTSGIPYAIVNKNQIYIENTGISEVVGFNGAIDIAIIINTTGILDSIIYLSSQETPTYINKIFRNNYFKQYHVLKLNKTHIIDAVSGSTISSIAIAKSVNELFMLSEQNILEDYITANNFNFKVIAKLNKIWIVNLLILFFVFALVSIKRFRKKKNLMVLSIFTVIWLGFYLNSSFTWLLFAKSFTTASLSVFTIAYILIVLSSSIWQKNTYCKHICPFGNAQKLVFKLSTYKKRKAVFKNKHLKILRYIITAFVVIGYLSGFEILSEYELFPYFFDINTSYIMLSISALVMLISVRIPNLWCRALCPTGCVLDTLSDFSENKIVKT